MTTEEERRLGTKEPEQAARRKTRNSQEERRSADTPIQCVWCPSAYRAVRFPSWLQEFHKVLLAVDLGHLARRKRRLLVMLPPSVSQVTLNGLEGRQEGSENKDGLEVPYSPLLRVMDKRDGEEGMVKMSNLLVLEALER
ncbi:hypothetical protein LEMLEM_LOCUS14040 [Lemmus lemmus]